VPREAPEDEFLPLGAVARIILRRHIGSPPDGRRTSSAWRVHFEAKTGSGDS
jgi:hypothetical protein